MSFLPLMIDLNRVMADPGAGAGGGARAGVRTGAGAGAGAGAGSGAGVGAGVGKAVRPGIMQLFPMTKTFIPGHMLLDTKALLETTCRHLKQLYAPVGIGSRSVDGSLSYFLCLRASIALVPSSPSPSS